MEKSISRTWVGDLLRGEGESKEVEAVFHQIWFEKHKGLVLICRFNLVSLVLVQVPNVGEKMKLIISSRKLSIDSSHPHIITNPFQFLLAS
ncbi:unnamed protein product [Lactuca virosa]|uniref:Uncharacterized protein n=1 Tax=Lactuca virosa TaxID=75947 RepID=A0AAU9MMR6_9ASTR|nr:unnamed protein product [Lactuca virosa]